MSQSSFFSRWTGRPETGNDPPVESDRSLPELLPSIKRRSQVSVWGASPSLERVHYELDEQIRIIEEAKRLLEERLAPFQRLLLEQRCSVDQRLKQRMPVSSRCGSIWRVRGASLSGSECISTRN